MLWICQEEDMCPYSLNAWWGGKIPRIPDGELQRLVEFWGQKRKKETYIPTCCLGFKKNPPHSSKNILQHIQWSENFFFFFYPIRFCTRKSNFVWKCVNIFFMKIISKQIIFFFFMIWGWNMAKTVFWKVSWELKCTFKVMPWYSDMYKNLLWFSGSSNNFKEIYKL